MKIFLAIFTFLFFIGCGGGGSSSNNNQPTIEEKNTSIDLPPLKDIYDSGFKYQWYLEKNDEIYGQYGINDNAHIQAGDYLRRFSGKGVKIAVIDSGMDVTHNDLRNAIKGTYNEQTGTSDVSGDEHGTEVVGVIGARANDIDMLGVANQSDIYFIKRGDWAYESQIVNMFKKANEFGADIINCSWGTVDATNPNGSVGDTVKEYIQYLANNGRNGKGTLIVFASGNDDIPMGNDESAIPEVIGVGASNAYSLRATYSNYGPNLDVLAPGGNTDYVNEQGIYTLYNNNRTTYVQGTSYSAPIVSGVLALMLEANPNLTRIQVENILKTTSDKIGNINYENGHNVYYGYGKISAKKAIDEALKLR